MQNNDVFEFRKIPFAKPPIGKLRFEKPEKYGIWAGTLDATKFGPSCYQTLGLEKDILPNKNISEDCLHLNIYVPVNISCNSKKSVMVWIHGGGYIYGQSSMYDGSYLAVTGDVIMVTINYRLGVFGFYTSGDSAARGNYGIWDQILAIQWVKDNIASFGGDSESITIFGESAGAFSVGILSLIPSNKGLFQRAILQSGTALSSYTLSSNAVTASSEIARSLNCTQKDKLMKTECVKGVRADDVFNAFSSIKIYDLLDLYFAPVIDNDLLKNDPLKLLQDTDSESFSFFRSLDVLIGTVSKESSEFLPYVIDLQPIYNYNITKGIPKSVLCDVLAPEISNKHYNNDSKVSAAICEKYGGASNMEELRMNIMDAYSDFLFFVPAVQSLHLHANGNKDKSKRYHYVFSRPSPLQSNLGVEWFKGSYHADDIMFQFPFFDWSSSDSDRFVALTFMKYWTNFAKTG